MDFLEGVSVANSMTFLYPTLLMSLLPFCEYVRVTYKLFYFSTYGAKAWGAPMQNPTFAFQMKLLSVRITQFEPYLFQIIGYSSLLSVFLKNLLGVSILVVSEIQFGHFLQISDKVAECRMESTIALN